MNKLDDETTYITQRRTLEQLKKEAYQRYGNEVDIDKIYARLPCEIYSALNFLFRYSDSGCYCDNDVYKISDEEEKLMTLYIIGSMIDNKEDLLDIQSPQDYDDASDPASLQDYLSMFDKVYIDILEALYILRDAFDYIKERYPRNYPSWINEWLLFFELSIVGHYGKNYCDTKSKKQAVNNIKLIKFLHNIFLCVMERSTDFMKKQNGKRIGQAVNQTYPEQGTLTLD